MKKLTNFVSIISIVVFLFPFSEALAMDKDTLRVYWFDPVEVTAKRVGWGNTQFPIERDNYTKLFNTSGYTMIRKGVFFAQDIYVDGFKRGDINVVIDGEHYHNACPNRMDSPLTRINPMEMKTIDLIKNGGGLQSGLAGTISFHREQPSELFKIKGGLNHTLASSHSSDAAFTITSHNYRFNGRYATGSAYKDAKGRSFVDLYGYKDDYRYNLGELSFQGSNKEWDYRASYSYTEDVMFPYLMMDER
ncbi:MAG: hypothetical protein GY855_14810, partial [candidate division Zixibacteria bacterium]|nr:hypothetical protein [candidate division Zixibacteria bacterium]